MEYLPTDWRQPRVTHPQPDHVSGSACLLQQFRHYSYAINLGNPMSDNLARRGTETTVMLLPSQDIVADMGGDVVVHDDESLIYDNRNAGKL